jgi:hypothetical protein
MEVYMNQYVNQPNGEPTLPLDLCGEVWLSCMTQAKTVRHDDRPPDTLSRSCAVTPYRRD